MARESHMGEYDSGGNWKKGQSNWFNMAILQCFRTPVLLINKQFCVLCTLFFLKFWFQELFSLQQITFQTFLISDGENTFAVYNYVDVNLPYKHGLRISVGYRFDNTIVQKRTSNDRSVFRMSDVPGNGSKLITYLQVGT